MCDGGGVHVGGRRRSRSRSLSAYLVPHLHREEENSYAS